MASAVPSDPQMTRALAHAGHELFDRIAFLPVMTARVTNPRLLLNRDRYTKICTGVCNFRV
jgi:hypothetical protein